MTDRPACPCHGIEMYWHRYSDGRPNGGIWRCREKRKVYDRKQAEAYHYERMPFAVRARKALYQRRYHALKRRRERHERNLA